MSKVQTVFSVNGSKQGNIFDGAGQQTVTNALSVFPKSVVKLEGFMINGTFKKADLTSHWERTQFRKEK